MKFVIPAPVGYKLLYSNQGRYSTLPVIAFLIDGAHAPVPLTSTGETLDDSDGLVLPDGRVFADGFEHRSERAYIDNRKAATA